MYIYFARQLVGLKKIDGPLFTRRYYLLEVNQLIFYLVEFFFVIEFKYGSIIYTSS